MIILYGLIWSAVLDLSSCSFYVSTCVCFFLCLMAVNSRLCWLLFSRVLVIRDRLKCISTIRSQNRELISLG